MPNDQLFFYPWCVVHQRVNDGIKAWEDEAFSFLDEILEEAKNQFSRSDVFLLPKTPSAKRKRGRRKRSSQCSNHSSVADSSEHDECPNSSAETSQTRSTRSTRATRATKKDTTVDEPVMSLNNLCPETFTTESSDQEEGSHSSARPTKASSGKPSRSTKTTKGKKKKTSVEEPVMSLSKECTAANMTESDMEVEHTHSSSSEEPTNKKAKHSTDLQKSRLEGEEVSKNISSVDKKSEIINVPSDGSEPAMSHDTDGGEVEESFVEVTEEWTQCIAAKFDPANALETPVKTIIENHSLKPKMAKTPIQNFNHMNVKEKVQAYEEIVLISPGPYSDKDNSPENTPTNTHRPTSAVTPDTIVSNKVISALSPTHESKDKRHSMESTEGKRLSEHCGTPTGRLSTDRRSTRSRKSFRESLRTSLHILPSKEKEMKRHLEVPNKPVKRTRLRLKKTDKEPVEDSRVDESSSSQEEMETDVGTTDSGAEVDTAYSSEETSNSLKTGRHSSNEEMSVEEPQIATSSTRTKTRHASKKGNPVETEPAEEATLDDQQSPPSSPAPVRSTRTKTRTHQAPVSALAEEQNKKDSGIGSSLSSQPDDTRPRVTRSKMRKPKKSNDQGNQSVFTSPEQPAPRVTRTKTRKRQLDGSSDDEPTRRSKRSCTGILSDDTVDTPTKCITTDDESTDGEHDSPACPSDKLIRPHPKSFLNNLKTASSSSNLRPGNATTGGLVKSFVVAKNSPRPTARDIRDKQKKEFLEKQKKNEERLKKREDEYKKKMDEMRKKREEKMKKVQQLREQKKMEEQENRAQLEKRLAHKRLLTNKLREDRLRDEKEKQKLRTQKYEEAEERRKQEEAERKKKIHEQMKNEKSHEAFLARKKEFEETERAKKIEEEKQKAQERLAEMEREREKERERLLQLEEEREREWQKKKEERDQQVLKEKAERERQEMEKKREKDLQMKAEMERIKEQERVRLQEQEKVREQQRRQEEELKKMVDKHNSQVPVAQPAKPNTSGLPKPNLNKTKSLEKATVAQPRTHSYDMTPDKVPQASSDPENYNINDLNSGDETDDEDAPRKEIPSWAQGSHLKTLLIKQHYNPPDLDKLFDYIEAPDLNVLFEKKKARFNKRTSSAHWDTPILRPGTLGRT